MIKNNIKKIIFIFLIIFINIESNIFAFETITQAEDFAQIIPENPNQDNTNLLKPIYDTTYKKQTKSLLMQYFDNILIFFKIKQKELWSPKEFCQTIKRVALKRENNSFYDNFIQALKPELGTNFIIYGNLHGSFHSFVRTLRELFKLNYINNNLEIIKPNTYLIINGNAVNLSPYNLETLTLILNIIEKNPNKVFYIKGKEEYQDYWQNFNLKDEILIKAQNLNSEKMINFLTRFFNTLPLALYIRMNQEEFLRISFFNRDFSLLDETNFSDFLLNVDSNYIKTLKLTNFKKGKKIVNIKAIIKGTETGFIYTTTEGLKYLPPDKGSSAWTILSCPNKTYQKAYEFFYDAFAVLKTSSDENLYTIELYNQEISSKNSFKKTDYNFLSGQKVIRELKAKTS